MATLGGRVLNGLGDRRALGATRAQRHAAGAAASLASDAAAASAEAWLCDVDTRYVRAVVVEFVVSLLEAGWPSRINVMN